MQKGSDIRIIDLKKRESVMGTNIRNLTNAMKRDVLTG